MLAICALFGGGEGTFNRLGFRVCRGNGDLTGFQLLGDLTHEVHMQ